MNENCLLIQIPRKSDLKGPMDNKTSLGSDNGLTPDRRQAFILTNAGIGYRRA